MHSARRVLLGSFLTLLPVFALAAQTSVAQTSWPTSPVRLIMPYPPASSGDLITRKVVPFLSQKLGAPFFVENRPGANGNIGMKAVSLKSSMAVEIRARIAAPIPILTASSTSSVQ